MESGPEAITVCKQIPYGLAVRVPGFHPGGLALTSGMGTQAPLSFLLKRQVHLTAAEAFFDNSRATET